MFDLLLVSKELAEVTHPDLGCPDSGFKLGTLSLGTRLETPMYSRGGGLARRQCEAADAELDFVTSKCFADFTLLKTLIL